LSTIGASGIKVLRPAPLDRRYSMALRESFWEPTTTFCSRSPRTASMAVSYFGSVSMMSATRPWILPTRSDAAAFFAAEGMIIGTCGAVLGYVVVVVGNLVAKLSGIEPGIDLASACGPGKAILGIFLGLAVGLIGSVLPVIFVVWRSPEKCLKGPK